MTLTTKDIETLQAVGRLKRAMPRNEDLLLVGAWVEEKVAAIRAVPVPLQQPPRFDRKAYQRDLMRKRRAADKAGGSHGSP